MGEWVCWLSASVGRVPTEASRSPGSEQTSDPWGLRGLLGPWYSSHQHSLPEGQTHPSLRQGMESENRFQTISGQYTLGLCVIRVALYMSNHTYILLRTYVHTMSGHYIDICASLNLTLYTPWLLVWYVRRYWSRTHFGGHTSVTMGSCGTWITIELTWSKP